MIRIIKVGGALFVVAILAVVIALFCSRPMHGPDHRFLRDISYAKQIYTAIEVTALDGGNRSAPLYPAESGAKTRIDYIRQLVKAGVLPESDALRSFCKSRVAVQSLGDLKPEHLAFQIANVSARDSSDTIFLVTVNYADHPEPVSWRRYFDGSDYKGGIAVLRRSGSGAVFRYQPTDSKKLGTLPPRQPAFLGD